MLINCSNHPAASWNDKQKQAAIKYGKIYDVPFPPIEPAATIQQIELLAGQFEVKIRHLLAEENTGNSVVHIMGELTFCFALVARLQKAGITCLASTSQRETLDNLDGSKTVRFGFVRFREYPLYNSQ